MEKRWHCIGEGRRLIITDNRTHAERAGFFFFFFSSPPTSATGFRRNVSPSRWSRWRLFVHHSCNAFRPVYIFDRAEERPSKLPSNFGRLANRCSNIHRGEILMRRYETSRTSRRSRFYRGIAIDVRPVQLNFNIPRDRWIAQRLNNIADRLAPFDRSPIVSHVRRVTVLG